MNMRLRCPRLSLTIKFLALLFAMAATIEAASLHVAGRGDDGNPGTRREPFKTLPKALAAVSERDWTSGDLVIHVDPGIYWNAETLVLDNSVSGPADGELVIRSAGGPGAARFIGGEPTGPWQLHEGEVWKTPMPSGRVFHVLYENGRMCHKARFPNHGEEPRFPVYSETATRSYNSAMGRLASISGWRDRIPCTSSRCE